MFTTRTASLIASRQLIATTGQTGKNQTGRNQTGRGGMALAAALAATLAITVGLAHPAQAQIAAPKPALPVPAQPAPAAAPAAPPGPVQKLYAQPFADWVYRCLATAQAGKPATLFCSVQQNLLLKRNGQVSPLLTLTIIKAEPKGHNMNLAVPLGVALKEGVALSVDNAKPFNLAYTYCNNASCFVLNEPAYGFIKQLHNAKTAHVKISLMSGKPITIDVSLKGLTAALAALDSGKLPTGPAQSG